MPTSIPILTDICWTLYRSNTTFDFLDAVLLDEGYRRLRRWSRNPIVRRANILLLRIFGRDFVRERALRYLHKEYDEQQIAKLAQKYVQQDLAERKIEEVWRTIDGQEVILISGTIVPIAQAVAQEVHATRVYAGDIFKRGVAHDVPEYDIVTDNLSDYRLVQAARHATIVLYDNRDRWEKKITNTNITYIDSKTGKY